MLSTVLRSRRAVQVNIEIMRTFVRLRQLIAGNADLARLLLSRALRSHSATAATSAEGRQPS
jgi:hypothetical protein